MQNQTNKIGSMVDGGTMSADMIVSSISQLRDSSLIRSSAFKKRQVLLKAATAMLSKAQASSQNVLTLLQA